MELVFTHAFDFDYVVVYKFHPQLPMKYLYVLICNSKVEDEAVAYSPFIFSTSAIMTPTD